MALRYLLVRFPTLATLLLYVPYTPPGTEFMDNMTIAPGVVIPSQSIGVASFSHGIKDADGILGWAWTQTSPHVICVHTVLYSLGPRNLTIGSLSPSTVSSIPTITDSLYSQGMTSSNMVSVSFEPTNTSSAMSGELTFGGIDPSKVTGNITFTYVVAAWFCDVYFLYRAGLGSPLTRTFPASRYWGIDQSIHYGNSTPILETTAGIVDTGTTLILMASGA